MKLTRNRLKNLHAPPITIDEALFGLEFAPNEELRQNRQVLITRFRAIMDDWKEPSPVKLVDYLVYRPEVDGESKIMTLVDELIEHCKLEKDARSASVANATGLH